MIEHRSLGARELATLQCMADGKTNAEIGVELRLSLETIKTYVRRILDKLDARSRTHAVAIGLRENLID